MRLRLPILFLLFLLFSVVSRSAFAQTVCVAPYNPTPASSWGMVQKFQSNALIWNGGTPTAADLNGDGISEILAPANDFSGYYVYKGDGTNKTTATKDFVISTSSTRSVQPAIANLIGNASSAPEVVMVNTAGFVYIFASTGGTESNFLFKSTTASQYTTEATPYIVDIDQDGTAEIVVGSDVFGIVGNALVKRVAGPALGYIGATSGNTGTPVDVIVADIISSNPGKELIYGSRVYGVNLATGVTTILKDLSTIVGTSLIAANDNGPTAIGDMNGDGKFDIVYNGSTFVVMWDPNGTTAANTLLFRRIPPSFVYGVRGLPLIANVFDDKTTGGKSTDLPEAVIINSSGGSSGIVTAYNLNYNTTAGTATQHIWSLATNDMSGCTGITAFDFDGNGLREIVYRDQSTLRIINGNRTTPVNYATESVSSATWGEYPIVADLNNDGQAEIAVTGNGMLQVFGSDPATFPWKGAPTYWNQRNYRIVNVNSNLTIPATEINSASAIAYNNNAAQFQFTDAVGNGVPSGNTYAPDAQITINTVTTDCPRITVNATISNSGSFVLPAGTSVAMYDANPTTGAANLIGTFQTTASIAAGASQAVTMTANLVSLSTTVFAVVNDRGTTTRPFNLSSWTPNTGINECTYTNNIDSKTFTCIDSDGDSVVDFIDIDDDNDGVLDTAEQSGSCANVTLTPFSATSSPVYGGSTATRTIDGSGFTGTGLAALASSPAVLENAWLLKEPETSGFIEYLMPSGSSVGGVALWAPDAFNYGGGDGPPKDFTVEVTYEGGRIFTSQIFTTAQPNSSGALPGAQPFYFPKALFNVTKIRLNILSGWYDINNNSVGQVSTDGLTVNFAYNMFLGEFRAICGVADIDNDNDGIPNRLDLDSDGDGCTDAIEAGVSGTLNSGAVKNGVNGAVTSTTTLPNAIAAGIYGANGFANSLETATDNGVINYTSTYAYATMRGYAACVDSDNDNINDVVDVDDDNDGVLDLTELTCTSPLNAVAPTAAGATSIFSDNNSGNFIKLGGATVSSIATTLYETNIDVVQFAGTSSGAIVLNTTYQQLKIAVADVDQSESITLKVYDVLGNLIPLSSSNILEKGSYVNPTYPAGSSMVLTSAGALDYDGSTNAISNSLIEIPYTAKRIEIYKTAGSNNTWVGLFAGCNDGDTDNDGIPNRLDRDSDGDGCSDALESGATTSTTANFAFTGAMGANGLDNSLENGGNGLINYTSTYDFAISKNYANCRDTDSDGITDLNDIDDDNDGVLDAIESPGCFFQSNEWNSSNKSLFATISSDLNLAVPNDNLAALVNGIGSTAAAVEFISTPTQSQLNKALLKIELSHPTQLDAIYIQKTSATQLFTGTSSVKVQGSINNTDWTDLTAAITPPANATNVTAVGVLTLPNSNKFTLTTNPGAYKYYRIYGVTASNVSSGIASEVYFDVNMAKYQASNYTKVSCGNDTDGDGKYNHLDLDSDADGCSDAFEAGTTLDKTANFAHPTSGVGTNGLLNSFETIPDNGIYNGTYTYDSAVDNSVNKCTDTDNDGVIDLIDLDDDNDGILDLTEQATCIGTVPFTFKNINGSTTGAFGYNAAFPSWMQLSFNQFQPGYTLTFDSPVEDIALQFASIYDFDRYGKFTAKLSDGTIIENIDFNLSTTFAPTAAIWTPQPNNVNNFTGNFTKNYGAPFDSGTPFFQTTNLTSGDAQSWGIVHFKNIPGAKTKGIVELSFTILESTATSGTAGLAVYSKCVTFLDTDGDGIPNRLDLDSDRDGCSDAVEGGSSTTATSTTVYPTGTDSNGNGLLDVYEGTPAGTINYFLTYNSFALISSINACADTDSDAIKDIVDLDDDNDGVLDAIESPNCFFTANELRRPIAVSTQLAMHSTNLIANTIDDDPATASAFAPNVNWVGLELFKVTAASSIKITGLTLGNLVSWPLSNGATNTFKLQGSVDNVNWTDLSAAVASTLNTGNFVIANTLEPTKSFTHYRIVGAAGVSWYGGVGEITFNIASDFNPSANPKAICTNDTDGDQKLNHQDLDSDGDGCADAIESGSSTTATSITVYPVTNGTTTDSNSNGLLNQYEGTTPGFINYNATYDFALSAAFNRCLDSDTDGVVDYVDLDDDNDGVLDNVESPACFYTNQELRVPIAVSSELTQHTSSYVIGNSIDTNTSTASAFATGQNWVGKEIFKFTAADYVPLTAITFDLVSWALSADGSSTFKLQGSSDNQSWTDLSAAISSTATTATLTVSNTLATTVKFKFFRLIGVAGTSSYGGVLTARFVIPDSPNQLYQKPTCTTANDNDGTPNHLDLDSDGDGCSDAVEAGTAPIGTTAFSATSFFNPATTGTNGFADALETSPTSGIYKGTYTYLFASTNLINTCFDTDVDGVGDFIDLDDDNDGIPDLQELSCVAANATGTCTPTQLGTQQYGITSHCTGWVGFDYDPSPTVTVVTNFDYMGLTNGIPYFDFQGSVGSSATTVLCGKMYKNFTTVPGITYTYTINLMSSFVDAEGIKPQLKGVDFATGIELGATYLNGTGNRSVTFTAIGTTTSISVGLDSRTSLAYSGPNQFWYEVSHTANGMPYSVCTTIDTDNDGKTNSLDLDSDGDGCADAIEASSSTTARSTTTFPTGDDANRNGLLTTYEGTTAGTVNYTSTYTNFALVNTINACLDTDGDGFGDVLDLDDDNDGVLDTTELACAELTISKTGVIISKPATINYTFNGNTIANLIDGVDANVYVASGPTGTLTNSPLLNFEFPTPRALRYLEIGHYQGQQLFATGSTYKIQGSTDNTNWIDVSGTLSYNNIATSTSGGLSTHNSNIANFPSNTTAYKYYRVFGIAATSGGGWATEIYFKENSCSWDIDNDGKINSLDLDSDGDGCADAIEAGSSTTATSTTTFPTGDDTNRNGLLTTYEGTTAGTVNYTSTYTNYALSNTINACLDTDSDGIKNVVDIDDDNDGVLDLVEQSCANAVLSKSGITISSTVNWVFQNAPTGLNSLLDGNLIQQIYPSETNLNNKTILQFNLPSQKVLNLIELANNNNQTPLIAGGTYKIQGSNDGGATWVDIVASQVVANSSPILATTNSIKFDMSQNVSAFSTYRILGISITGQANWSQEVYFRESVCTNIDTDNDGTPNHLDLDSDGDSCSDAMEAKTVTSLTATTVSGGFGTNGFADNLETSGNGVYTGTYVYSRATDPTVKACLDSDFDGVPDVDDLDDDNDGLLDASECSVALLIENTPSNLGQVSRKSWTFSSIDESSVNSFAGGSFGTGRAEATQVVYGEVKLPPAATTVIQEPLTSLDFPSLNQGTVIYREFYVKIPATAAFTNASQIAFRIGNSNTTWNVAMLYVSHKGASITTPKFGGGGSNSLLLTTNRDDLKLVSQTKFNTVDNYIGGAFITSAANAGKWVRMAVAMHDGGQFEQATVQYSLVSPLTSFSAWSPVDVANGFQFAATGMGNSLDDSNLVCDFDGDGIPNTLDLDSDGDGCSDANEAYNSASTQGTDGNQYFGTGNPPAVDVTGKVTGANSTSLNSNFLSVGSASVVTVQPTDQTTTPGGQAIFASTVTAGSGTTTYQWQLSTDGGTNWSNVANSSTYAGATTSTLTVSNVTVGMKGYRYRLQLSQSNYVCGNVTSVVAKIGMNNIPSIVDDAASGLEDTPLTGNVLTNDTGSGTPAGTLTVTNFTVAGVSGTFTVGQTASIPNVGTIQITSTGAYTFTPVANYSGTVPVISYTATDANGGSDIGDLRISITPVNDPPVAVDDVKSTNENTAVSGNVLTDGTDDSDVDGNTLTITQFTINGVSYNPGTTVSIPGVGTVVVATTGSYTFTPAAGYTGAVPAIDYTISDGNGGSDVGRLSITVNNVNDAPLAADDIATGPQGTTLTGSSVLTNDTDVEGNTLTVTGFTVAGVSGTPVIGTAFPIPNVGSITINANGTYTFQPLANFTGQVPLITYTVSDGQGGTDTAVLDIYVAPVNQLPTATPDAKTINEDSQATGNVLTDATPDSDPDANTVLKVTQYSFTSGSTTYTYPAGTIASIPGVGVVVINTNGSYTFTPNANYNGAVPVITYTITDDNSGAATGATVSSTLTITITPINDDPIAVNDDNKTTPEDTPVTVNVLTNDSDLDAGSTLTVTQFTIDGIVGTFTTTATIPGKGIITALSTGQFTFTPDPNFNGVVPRITYTVSDGVGTNTAYLNLTVTPVNDPPTVVNETPNTLENTSLAGNVLTDGTDDSDVDGNTLSISQFSIGGVTYPAGSIVELPGVGTLIVNADGTYTFTPNQGYFGTVPTVTYTVSDGNGGTTNGTLVITVIPVNDPPVVVNESLSIQEDATASGNLLANDSDPEQANSALTISQFTIAGVTGTFTPGTTAVVIPNVGSIVINANGTYTFTPEANYNGIVPAIEYRVSDGQGAFTNGTLTIVVAAVNDAPTVTNDTKSEPVNTPIVGNVLTNDRDIEGTALSLTKFTIGGVDYSAGTTATIVGVGTVLINADGTYTFTPATNYVGSPPVITYTVSDGTATSTATLSLTITPIDADGDGIPDATEKGTGSTPRDSDNDGTPDYLDTDSDNDGIPDAAEDALCIGFLPCTPTDTDGDGTPDYRDLDSDGDGISDAIEGTTDTDGDGIPNYQDTDSDGDGILDSVEKGPTATPVDTDLDGTPDYRDLDSDGDGIPDATEGALDTDADGVPNFRDLDSDGDGISDAIEGTTDTDGDGTPNYLDTDSDGDGISDAIEKGPTGTPVDTDGDGTPDYKDLDSDNDGILDSTETATDTDNDGIPNFRDLDSDGDGILDAIEGTVDSDGDGTPNYRDVDSDGDGIPDSIEKGTGSVPVDTDGDGTPDYLDLDTDGDGVPDAVEDAGCTGTAPCTPTDTDGDGTPNFRDLDSDGDGLTDAVEKGPNGATPVDTDGDTTPDYLDVDSDADGISDAIEKGTGTTPVDTDGDGTPDYRDTDSDNDGITDAIEKGPGSTPVDTDNDGTPDYRDLDSDGDGKSDQSEGTVDTDNDGTPNYLDLDSDGDGVVDAVDVCPLVNGLGSSNGCPPDSDGDGLADVDDSDDDNDGILDTVEAAACSPSAGDCDTDGDGIPNRLDLDSDGDGISDVIEANGTDANNDGIADGAVDSNGVPASANGGLTPPDTDGTGASNPYDLDSDGDGILDAIEKGTGTTLADTDNDNIPDYLDTDSDGDGISDAIEKGSGTAVADTDGDGIPDFRDLDSDGDGIPDAIEKGSGSTPVDSDNDGIPNFRDVDSDGDGILDSVEDAACSGITPCTPTDTDGDNTPDYLDLDSDADGIPDAIEGTVDTDRDGLPDYLDTDSDGDGIVDSVEDAGCTGTMPCTPTDTDGDGIPNFRDLDSDGDGITDAIEGTTDTDGDSIPNYLDPDSDGDGISDAIEGNVDSDGDGTPNYKDLDSDGDNIPDAIEKGTMTAPVDTDSDGTPDYLDTDTDGDGIPDAVEDSGCALNATTCTPTDTDGDGIPNHKDLDSDNDGIPDSVEKGIDGANPDNTDGTDTPNYLDADSDNDGISDAIERGINGNSPLDTDGDGTPDYKEVDSDNDGIPDAVEGTTDTDGDGLPDYRDTDSDNDGILDNTEDIGCTGTAPCTPTDSDNDGTPNYKDLDSDGDGKPDLSEGESDFDGDGTPNYLDLDSDADGVNDNVDMCPLLFGTYDRGCPIDSDGDGVYDVDDADDDNDGLLDTLEAAACSPSDPDCDTDGDGIPNRLDPDSDNDGINDVRESNGTDVDGDGKVDGTVDADGVPSSTNGGLTPPNTDGTTLPDPYDTDSDGDGISDALERGPNPNAPVDTDADGTPDYRDTDSDNDGIPDSVERGTGAAILDTDGDGTPDYKDLDSDNDGITDAVEKGPSGATPLDTDGDGIPNYRDLDSDGDGIPDSIEKGTGSTLLDTDGDLIPDYLDTDSDGDGISDAIEKGLNGNSPLDTDGDGIPDYRDTDSDNDGIPDSVEKGTGSTPIDTDGDGVPNYRDLDSDGDGITDAVEKGANGATPVDTDSDGLPDYVDLDSDGDGKLDAIEKGTGTTLLDTDRDGIPDYRDVDNYGQPDVNVTDVSVPVVGNVKTNDAVPAGTTYGQPAAIAGATLVMDPATGTYTFTSSTPGQYVYLIPVCGPNQTTNCPLTPLQITVLDPLAVDKPVVNTDFAILEQGGSATVAILANDKAGDLGKTIDAASLVVLTAPAQGTAVVNSDGTITYTPSPFFVGVDSLEYRICDTNNPAQCQTATVYFTVEPAGLVVKTGAVDDFAIVRASPDGTANVTGNVLSNDLNGAGATLTANLVTGPTSAQGTFTLNANGTYSFAPAAGFSGPVDIVYEACGGSPVVCTKATLHILVEPMPTLVNDTNTAFANVPKAGDISINDTNPAGTTYGQPAQQTGATLTVNADGTYSFTATAAGTYTYTVPVCAPGQVGTCPTQTLTLTVTAPSPVNDTNTAFANVPKTGDLSTNDTNPAGSTYGQPAQQTGATLTVNADGTYSFTATAAGTYTYTVPVCAPGQTTNCPTQTLTITVTAPSLVNDTDTAFANVPKTGNLSTNDTNPAGSTYGQPAQQTGATLTVNADGTYSFTATAAGTYTYTVPVCAPGQTTNCPTQTLTITVTAPSLVNDTATAFANVPKTGNLSTNDTNPAGSTYGQPAQQAGATLTVNADGTYSFTAPAAGTYTYTVPVCAPGQTANCPTQTLTITVTAPSLVNDTNTALANVPKTGNLSTNDTNPAGSTYGQPAQQTGATLTVNADGTYSFTATAAGTYTYTVPVCAPGQTANCPTQTLTITVTAPSPVNDTDTALAYVPKTGNLSTNDTNPAGSTYGQPAQQAGATLTVNADGTYSFTATAAGTYTYTISVCAPGQTTNCPTQTLTITVTAPSLVNDTNTALANVPKTGNLSTNDTNPAGSTYGQPAQQTGATLTVNADGTYSFTATAAGTYTYTVPVCAPGQTTNCPTQTLTITVTAPSLVNDTDTALANVPKAGDLSTNDRNPEGTTYGQPAQQAGATITVNADGSYSFTATAVGTYTYTVSVCAPGQTANCPTQTLTITVTAPSLVNDTNTALANVPKTGNLSTNDTNPAGSTYGQPAQQTGATLTVNADGTYSFTATAAGTYTYTVTVCAPGQTTNCPTQTLTITVTGNALVAGIDNFQANEINGLTGGIAGNVLANDALDGQPINPDQVVITIKNDGGLTGVVIDKDGNLILPAGMSQGTYVVIYTICDVLNPTNCREAMVMIQVFLPVDLRVTKSVEAPEWFEGDEFTYTIRLENAGKTSATAVVLTDKLPEGLRYVSSVSSQIPVTTQVKGQEITWNMTQLPIAGATDITLKVKAAPLVDGKEQIVLNTVSVTAKERELSTADNTSSVSVRLKAFFIPNTITPNGGGVNDTFEIPGLGRYVTNELVIINRWGDQVFERKNYQNDWGAEGLVSGTYFYILKVTDEKGKQESFKGFVEVVKERVR